MYNVSPPSPDELPSSGALLRSTLIAAVVAVALLVVVVLPSEYGVDPTGVGQALGLTEMGEIKMQLAREAAVADSLEAALAAAATPGSPARDGVPPAQAAAAAAPAGQPTAPLRAHLSEISLDPGEGLEIKLRMRAGATVNYSWATAGGVVNFDAHADNDSIRYFSYATGSAVPSDEGRLTAAFDGYHGWFWRNRTDGVVTVTLRTEGAYEELRMP